MPKLRAKDRPKSPESALNARPRKVHIVHGGKSGQLMTAELDGRTRLGKQYKQHVEALESHLGGDLTAPQARLVDQATRLGLLAAIAWQEALQCGVFVDGAPSPAVDTFIKATGQEREVLKLLGLKRISRDITLRDVLRGENDD